MTAETSTPIGNGAVPRQAPRLRASDAERAAVVDVLQDAVARGLLTHDEGGERMAHALAAKFRDELPPLTADLPAPPPAAPAPPPVTAMGWGRLGSTFVEQVRSDVRTAMATPRSRRLVITALLALLAIVVLVSMVSMAMHGLYDGEGFEHHHDYGFEHHGPFDHD